MKTNLLFFTLLGSLWIAPLACAEEKAPDQDGFTINYNTVSILEYVRFASKISKVNFIYDEADLNFNITVVSDEPITARNVMATLVQVLRIHGLTMLEQDNSLVITRSEDVKQLANLVVDGQNAGNSPIVTRIFRIKYTSPDSLAAIIRPMISTAAILETVGETRQMILTDVTANVDKVASLIENIDSPNAFLDIKTYDIQHMSAHTLVDLASKIMNPIALGNPFLLVPQELANKIFVVSTPELTNKGIAVLTTLDTPPKKAISEIRKLGAENISVYKVINRPGDEILNGLDEIAKNLQAAGSPDPDLIDTIENAKWIKETNSIMLVGSKESLDKVREFLTALDVASKVSGEKSSFFVYKPQHRPAQEIESAIREMARNLKGTKGADDELIETVDSAKINPLTHTIIFSGEEKKFPQIKELLATIDTSTGKPLKTAVKNNFFLYKIQQAPEDEISDSLNNFAKSLDKSNAAEEGLIESIRDMKYIKETNSILFTGPEPALKRLQEILPSFDVAGPKVPASTQFYIYKPVYKKGESLISSLQDVTDHLKSDKLSDPALLHALESAKWVKSTNSIMFTGDDASLKKIEGLLSTLDVASGPPPKPGSEKSFFLYHPQYASKDRTEAYLKQVSDHLGKKNEEDLVDTIRSMKWIEPSQSFMFSGTHDSIARLQELLKNFDTPDKHQPEVPKGFAIIPLQYATQEKAEQYISQIADNLGKKGGSQDLAAALKSAKWIPESRSYMFHGTDPAIAQVKELMKSFDTADKAEPAAPQKGFALIQLQYATQERAEQYISQVADNLAKKGGSEDLVASLRSAKWIPESHSFMFSGTEPAIAQVKELMKSFDTTDVQQRKAPKPGYYIYKLQNTSGDVIEEDLDSLAKNFKSSGMKDTNILDVIDKMRYVKETNSILLTGDPTAIEEVKKMIADSDYARPAGPVNSSFYMYKPLHVKAAQIEKSLQDLGNSLKKSNLADPALLQAIASAKYVETTNSLVFTGTPESLQKIQGMIKDIDIAPDKHSPIQKVGKSTFLLYKLKNASGPQIVTSLKAMTANLKKSGATEKDLIAALNSVKYVKETNSLLFTGNEEALARVQTLVEQFDVTGLAPPPKPEAPVASGPSNFFVYKPQSLNGRDLEKIIADFAENLKSSGLNDPDLFNSITSMRWIDKTQSLVFTGTPKALDQVKELLKSFDIPSNLPEGPIPGSMEPTIQAIDNTSFLVYKLQFHKGDEIQGALRQIAKDLILSNAPVNQNLLNSINSLQWLEVTNSLLCSGDQETLTRLKELIKNLDIPLKQVFIEMLVIQTNLTNALTFGLEWGANYKYRDKFSGNTFNTTPTASGGTCTPDTFVNKLANLGPTGSPGIGSITPIPQNIPPGCGFDLGVVGEVIRHKGDTFLTLGSLLTALQQDSETTVIMTPKIITQDGKTSSIFVGENIPFVGSFVSNSSQNTINTSNIEYRDIGLNLTVTPVLGNSDIVTLDINLDRSQTTTDVTQASLNPSAQTANGIITSKTTMQTTVHVPDNHYLILSGMVNNSSAKVKTGIPCLGGLPIIGAAFSTAGDTNSNSNIVIFIRPHIINSLDDMKRITAHEEDFFRDQAGSPYLEHNYDESMELIKTVDDD